MVEFHQDDIDTFRGVDVQAYRILENIALRRMVQDRDIELSRLRDQMAAAPDEEGGDAP